MQKKAIALSLILGIGVALGFWWLRSPKPAPETARDWASAPEVARPPASAGATAAPSASGAGDPKIEILSEILAARNDGDPRLDTEFKDLSPETKERMRAVYRELAPEKLNEKGTIVFLLGRNLVNEVDYEFIDEVMVEPACRSLSDCSRLPAATTGEESHMESGAEVTLAYPKLVAIKALERQLEDESTPPGVTTEIQKRLEKAKTLDIPIVARQAEQALIKASSGT